MPRQTKPKVIAIVGPTASGKTALSIDLALHFSGEVISADSRQVYRGLDIGSAKVTTIEMRGIPHHLIDIANPTDTYTAADFKRDGETALSDITSRGKLPIVAGGTFFYLELLQGAQTSAPVPPNPDLRAMLEQRAADDLYNELKQKDPARASTIDKDNPRRLVRALEIVEAIGTVPPSHRTDSPYDWLTIGIDIPNDVLHELIYRRIISRLDEGMIEEVVQLHANGVSWDKLDSFGLEYRYIARYLQNMLSKEEMIEELNNKSRQFAKRQKTWLKRDKDIVWLPFPCDTKAAIAIADNFLKTS